MDFYTIPMPCKGLPEKVSYVTLALRKPFQTHKQEHISQSISQTNLRGRINPLKLMSYRNPGDATAVSVRFFTICIAGPHLKGLTTGDSRIITWQPLRRSSYIHETKTTEIEMGAPGTDPDRGTHFLINIVPERRAQPDLPSRKQEPGCCLFARSD